MDVEAARKVMKTPDMYSRESQLEAKKVLDAASSKAEAPPKIETKPNTVLDVINDLKSE